MRSRTLSIAACALAVSAATAAADTFAVEADGTGPYPTVQSAINASVNGDVVELGDGVFTGIGNRALFFSGRQITVRSRSGDPLACVIDAERSAQVLRFLSETPATVIENIGLVNGRSPTDGGVILVGSVAEPTLRGCVIAGGSASRGGGVFVRGKGVTMEDCWLIDNEAGEGGAVQVTNGAVAVIDGCLVAGNRSSALGGAGLWFGDSARGTVTSSTIAHNQATGVGGGLFVHGFTVVDMDRCIFWDNAASEGNDIHVWDLSCEVLVGCSVARPGEIGGYDGVTLGVDVIGSDPLFCATPVTFSALDSDAFALDDASPCLPANNACAARMGARPLCGGGTPTQTLSWGALKSRF